MNTVYKDYFKVHFFVLKCLGIELQPTKRSTTSFIYKIYSIMIFAIIYIYFPYSQILALVYAEDFESAIYNLAFFLTQCLGVIKIALVLVNKKKIRMFCKFIETPPFIPDQNRSGDLEFFYVKQAITACNTQGYIFYGLSVVIISQMGYESLTNPGYVNTFFDPTTNVTITEYIRPLPFIIKLPFETTDSPYYEIVSIYSLISGCIFGYSVGAMDAIICGIMCHIKGQLLILEECLSSYIPRGIYLMRANVKLLDSNQKLLQNITNNLNEIVEIPITLQKYVHIAVCDIIAHHQKIIKLAKDTDEVFYPLMLVQFACSLGIICFLLFQLSMADIGSVYFFRMSSYLALILFQTYCFCYRGNEVMLHSHKITDAAFKSLWFLTDLKTQKLLLIMIIRTCRPIRMTAGKFVFLSLESFVSILRGSASYFMVLKNVKTPATEL